MLDRNHTLMKFARQAKRSDTPVSVVTKGLRQQYQRFIPEIEAEYNRFKPRKK